MIARVALPIPVEKSFSYSVPDRWLPFLSRLMRVAVPFGNRTATGVVIDMEEGPGDGLKEIQGPTDIFPLADPVLDLLTTWASRHYVAPVGLVFKYALPSSALVEKYLSVTREERPDLPPVPFRKAAASLGRHEILRLAAADALTIFDTFEGNSFASPALSNAGGEASQRHNMLHVADMGERIDWYTSLIAEQLEAGNNVLMLLPDYRRLGARFFRAFRESFGERVLWYGSALKAKERMSTYFRARSRGGNLILGNKSGVFLPVTRLGLIIVERHEEEHYRNEGDFKFNAPLVAIKRAALTGIPVAFGSPAPSLEVCKLAEEGIFTLSRGERLGKREYSLSVTEKGVPSYQGLPEELTGILAPAVERGEKVVLYTPRKDYASYLECVECKTLLTCPVCASALSYRKSADLLVCPECGRKSPYREECPGCRSSLIRFSRIGAEYLEEQVKILFPALTVALVTGETGGREIDDLAKLPPGPAVIVGTQALAGVSSIRAGTLIFQGWEELARTRGWRAHERMFHILMHLIDSLDPGDLHFCMERKKRLDPDSFLDAMEFCEGEMERRKEGAFPPYTRFFLVEVAKKTEQAGKKAVALLMERLAVHPGGVEITGPLFQKKEKYEWRLIVKGAGDPLYETLLGLYDIRDLRLEPDPPYL